MFRLPRLTPLVKKLLIGLFAFFVLTVILEKWVGVPVVALLALNPVDLGLPTLWQPVTYVFVTPPEQVLSLLIGLLFLWWVLAPFEERYGSRRTVQLCLVAALFGSIPAIVFGQAMPTHAGHLYGFNGIILAAIAAYAWSLRHISTPLMVFGILPMRPVHLIVAVVGLSVLFFLINMNVTNLVADIGSVAGGILFVQWMTRPRGRKGPSPKKKGPRREIPFQVIQGGQSDDDRPRWLN